MITDTEPRLTLNADCEKIIAALTAAAEKHDTPLYAILDLAALVSPQQWLSRLKNIRGARSLFVGQPEARAESLAAWLIPLDASASATGPLLPRTVAQGLKADCVTWMLSDLDADELAIRLSQRLTARLPEGLALFRYYDPRLLPVIRGLWSESNQPDFFSLGRTWGYLDDYRKLCWIELCQGEARDRFEPPIVISVVQQQELQLVSEHHQLVRYLSKRRSSTLDAWDAGRKLDFVRSNDVLARSQGLETFLERLNFCIEALDAADVGAAHRDILQDGVKQSKSETQA